MHSAFTSSVFNYENMNLIVSLNIDVLALEIFPQWVPSLPRKMVNSFLVTYQYCIVYIIRQCTVGKGYFQRNTEYMDHKDSFPNYLKNEFAKLK